MFHDDCLTEDRKWVGEFCQRYQEEGFTQPFFCQSRSDIIVTQEDMVRSMAEAGLRGYFIGFESGNQRILNFLRKGTHLPGTWRPRGSAASTAWPSGRTICSAFRRRRREEVMDTVNMIREIDPDYYSPAFLHPTPRHRSVRLLHRARPEPDTRLRQLSTQPNGAEDQGARLRVPGWARDFSQKRKFGNRVRRQARSMARRYGDPSAVRPQAAPPGGSRAGSAAGAAGAHRVSP